MSTSPVSAGYSSPLSLQYQQQSSFSASLAASVKTADGTEINLSLQVQSSEAVQISLSQEAGSAPQGSETAPPSQIYGRGGHRHRRQERNFNAIDQNGDGVLAKDELAAAQQQRQESGHKTPLLDRAIEQFDALTAQSGKAGITFEQFFARPRGGTGGSPQGAPSVKAAG